MFLTSTLQTFFPKAASVLLLGLLVGAVGRASETLSPKEWEQVKAAEKARIKSIKKVYSSVVAIYPKARQGGGSGVIFDEEGFALTNHHVVRPVGEEGLGGIADGHLYKLTLIGVDPGGDIALVRLHAKGKRKGKGKNKARSLFTAARLGNSDQVQVGQWCMAMGNPFTLAEDQRPTVTLGIVSGVQRYQKGKGNIGVYGNCIQLDTSINPGNSGGPLFNLNGEVIGINGRGSFEERGRVNVGLGYAISIEQVKNFLPDLRAAKICTHGTLDAIFGDREGKVICEQINLDSDIASLGFQLGDELVAFDGKAIHSANQYANLVSTLPAKWPVHVVYKHEGKRKELWVRLRELTYGSGAKAKPKARPKGRPKGRGRPQPKIKGTPGKIRDAKMNRQECTRIFKRYTKFRGGKNAFSDVKVFRMEEEIHVMGKKIGTRVLLQATDGRFRVKQVTDKTEWGWDGKTYWRLASDKKMVRLEGAEAEKKKEVHHQRALAAFLGLRSLKGYKEIELEGGDKTQNWRADRVRVVDAQGNRMLFWFSLFDDQGNFQSRLLKMANEKGGKEKGPMWTFADYREIGGIQIPHLRRLVTGLSEQVQMEIKTTACEPVESFAEDLFKANEKDAAGK